MTRTLAVITIAVILAVTWVSCDKVKPPLPELQTPSPTVGASSPKGAQH
jgi:hypothetical protein